MIQNGDKEELKPCVHGQRESGTYFVATALHTGTQTHLPHAHTFPYIIPLFCIALYLQQQFPNSVGSSWYHAYKQRPKGQTADAGGAILQETALSHTCHLHSHELFSRHLKHTSLRIIHDLEISSFTPQPPQHLYFMDQVRGRLSLGGISKSGTCQREGKRDHLSYAGKSRGARYLSILICLTPGAHSKETEVPLGPAAWPALLSRLEILSHEKTQVGPPQAPPESRAVNGMERSSPWGKSKPQGGSSSATGQKRSLLSSSTWVTSQRGAGTLQPPCASQGTRY